MTLVPPVPKIFAPWTVEQVASLNAYQRSGIFHGFTCGSDHEIPAPLLATPEGWVCAAGCGYIQGWCHPWMANWAWQEMVTRMSGVTKGQQKKGHG